jgi:hypothetical protein
LPKEDLDALSDRRSQAKHSPMSDLKALAREIAARSKPRFISIPLEPKSKPRTALPRDPLARARAIAAASPPQFIEVERSVTMGPCVPSAVA